MHIAVCIKYVPVVSALEFDAVAKRLKRDGVPSEVSAFDIRALVCAVELKAAHGGEVIAVTMGPSNARQGLLECLALGADRAWHLCDRAFAGADTLATARALAAALRRERFDLILCGRNSVDAETGQVGAEIAELLDLPQVTGARRLEIDTTRRRLTAERETDDGFETVAAPLPALVTAAEDLAAERFPSKIDRHTAQAKSIIEITASDLGLPAEQLGSAGSPTQVIELHHVPMVRLGRVIDPASLDRAAAQLAHTLVHEHGLFETWRVPEQPALAAIAAHPQRDGPKEIWVLVEELQDVIRPVAFELLTKAVELATALGSGVAAVLLGNGTARHVPNLAAHGANRVLLGDEPGFSPYRTEAHAAALAAAVQQHVPGVVLMPATAMGRDLAPRLAARLGVGLTSDCIDIGLDAGGRLLQYKPAFGGTVVAPIVSTTVPEMATVRPGMLFSAPPHVAHDVVVARVAMTASLPRVEIIEHRATATPALELDRADIAVGVGMGFGTPAQLELVRPLIDILGAALCTTRDVTDKGWLPKQYQVGLTGRAIAPKLYIALGIRGAFEHVVGVRRAGIIVAINRNPRAPIFKAADYGVVADCTEFLPLLCRHLAAARAPH